ncbi:hypothetical protein ACN42_g843 [Penicillium freii]|uniref:Uncharacterized protein n=1 Tax=Penicillium freii TaxID=48697 RepID=A0A101MT02_PENFR|nr:hypothetical protein ACN42_g843 [Penicillium freii]
MHIFKSKKRQIYKPCHMEGIGMSTCIEYAVHQFTDRFQFQVPRDHEAIRFLCLGRVKKSKIRVKAGEKCYMQYDSDLLRTGRRSKNPRFFF